MFVLVIILGTSNLFATPVWSEGDKINGSGDLQQTMITGTIKDAETNDPMPGVNILVKGTTIGILTDAGGRYSLSVPNPRNAVLVFSFIGYRTQEVPIGNRTVIDVLLQGEVTGLEEVVVVGYGTVK